MKESGSSGESSNMKQLFPKDSEGAVPSFYKFPTTSQEVNVITVNMQPKDYKTEIGKEEKTLADQTEKIKKEKQKEYEKLIRQAEKDAKKNKTKQKQGT
jgi:hypothetical protein